MKDIQIHRPTLGPFMSVVCFRYLHDDAIDLAGEALIIDAGRQRGHDVIAEQGLANTGNNHTADTLYQELTKALGPDGTRLCLIKSVEAKDGGFEIKATECASHIYTLGVLIGAISAMSGKTMIGKQHEGADAHERIYNIEPL